jgi:hypothetical protein
MAENYRFVCLPARKTKPEASGRRISRLTVIPNVAGTMEEGRLRPMIARQRASSAGDRSVREDARRIIRDYLDAA